MTTLKKCLMFSLVAFLMLAALLWTPPAKGLNPPEGVMEQKILMLTVRYWKDEATLQTEEACDVPEGSDYTAMGCTVMGGPGRATLNLIKPKNWCDWGKLKTMGHELLHALGKDHEGYMFTKVGPAPWYGTSCDWVDE